MPADGHWISNPAKQRLKAGEPVFNLSVQEITRPVLAKIAAQAGGGQIFSLPSEVEIISEAALDFMKMVHQAEAPYRGPHRIDGEPHGGRAPAHKEAGGRAATAG